jgi:signal transduction histidine kinase
MFQLKTFSCILACRQLSLHHRFGARQTGTLRVFYRLPLQKAKVLIIMSCPGSVLSVNPIHILLVEDSATHVALIRDALAVQGRKITLTIAGSLAEAHARLTDFRPDLAIVDLLLPDGNGIELLLTVREVASFPIVILTSQGNEQKAVDAMKAGALDYLVKSPETLAALPHAIKRALREWHHITERKRAEEELRKTNRELDAFVYTVSHDLRSPLTPVIGYTAFLREHYQDRLDEQAVHILADIDRQAHRMLGLLEDLLALARVGHLECPAEPVDSNEVVREVVLGLMDRLVTAGMTVERGSLPFIRVPKNFQFQVFDNLIGNAVRYAGRAGEAIEVGGERQGERVMIYVRDHGPGIPEEERDRVFDLFYRGSTGKTVEGTGVGLATVQKIARLYGGRTWAEETPGGGSTFWVEVADGVRNQSEAGG